MKSVLVSIKPRHTANILAGLKTIELRKTGPGATPFKVYVYETHDGGKGCGAVVCEFICDKYCGPIFNFRGEADEKICEAACVSQEEIIAYANGGNVCGWHISELIIYDELKGLEEFAPHCRFIPDDILSCDHTKISCQYQHFDYNRWPDCSLNVVNCKKRMKRPPQSWCYVEEVQE